MQQSRASLITFIKSHDLHKAILLATAAILPLAISAYSGKISVGVAMALGVIISSPSDIRGSFRRRVTGIATSIALAVLATIVMGYSGDYLYIYVPVLTLLVLSFSFISVYGFRASLVSFSGLFAIVLSMANIPSGSTVLIHAGLIGCGGLWYLALSSFFHLLNPKRQTEELLTEIFTLTADHLRLRAHLINSSPQEQEIYKKELSNLQTDLNDRHETVRELVISKRRNFGKSTTARKKLLIFIELVDILELGMANPVNYQRMDTLFARKKERLEVLKDLTFLMADQLDTISRALKDNSKYKPEPGLQEGLKKAREVISTFEKELPGSREPMLVYTGLYHFKEKQNQKIASIERLLGNLKGKEILVKTREAIKFIPSQDYSVKILQDHLDLKSPIFRHSLRLTVILLAGYGIGGLLELQNSYWILLTSLVIMRPGYALTKERFKQRLYGTLIGGGVAASIIFLTQNTVVYGILAVITLVLAFSMLQKNYKAAAALITLNIVFVYSFLTPNAFEVIQFRVLDTVIGAALAFLGNAFLWPTWEYSGIRKFFAESLLADIAYLREIDRYYQAKGELPTSYKLARKEAFLAMGNLNAAFQRMTQEPRSKQKDLTRTYKMVTLNQELLASLASLSAFIRTHQTTEASEHFKVYIEAIQTRLSGTLSQVTDQPSETGADLQDVEKAERYFKNQIKELSRVRDREIETGKTRISPEMRSRFQEAQLVRDQLQWLLQISEKLEALHLKAPGY